MEYTVLYPGLFLLIASIVILMLQSYMSGVLKNRLAIFISLVGVILAFGSAANLVGINSSFFKQALRVDDFGIFLSLIVFIGTGLSILVSDRYLKQVKVDGAEYYALILMAASGMYFLTISGDLIAFLISLEIMSISIYILAGIHRASTKSNEASMKYLILGAFSTGFLLFGISLIYGATGTIIISEIATIQSPLLIVGLGFMLIGFLFKVGAVPFQGWVPDVYEGSPTPITAFMAVGVKTAGFAAFLRIILIAFSGYAEQWFVILQVVSVLSMIVGNVVAISQHNLKRLLAYSSIAHTGYILLAFAAAKTDPNMGSTSVIFYLLTYTFTSVGAFAAIIATGKETLEDIAGYAQDNKLMGAAMAVFFFSLAGIPTTAGFMGKLFVFMTAIDQKLYWASIIGIITSIISVYYYLRVVVYLYFKPLAEKSEESLLQLDLGIASALAVAGVFVLGIIPQKFIEYILTSYQSMF